MRQLFFEVYQIRKDREQLLGVATSMKGVAMIRSRALKKQRRKEPEIIVRQVLIRVQEPYLGSEVL